MRARTTPDCGSKLPPGMVAVIAAQAAKKAATAASTRSSPLRCEGTEAMAMSSLICALDIDVDVQAAYFDISEPAVDRRSVVGVRVQVAQLRSPGEGAGGQPGRE